MVGKRVGVWEVGCKGGRLVLTILILLSFFARILRVFFSPFNPQISYQYILWIPSSTIYLFYSRIILYNKSIFLSNLNQQEILKIYFKNCITLNNIFAKKIFIGKYFKFSFILYLKSSKKSCYLTIIDMVFTEFIKT